MTNVLWDQRKRKAEGKNQKWHTEREKKNYQRAEAVELWLICKVAVGVFLLVEPKWRTIRNWLENHQDNSHGQASYRRA